MQMESHPGTTSCRVSAAHADAHLALEAATANLIRATWIMKRFPHAGLTAAIEASDPVIFHARAQFYLRKYATWRAALAAVTAFYVRMPNAARPSMLIDFTDDEMRYHAHTRTMTRVGTAGKLLPPTIARVFPLSVTEPSMKWTMETEFPAWVRGSDTDTDRLCVMQLEVEAYASGEYRYYHDRWLNYKRDAMSKAARMKTIILLSLGDRIARGPLFSIVIPMALDKETGDAMRKTDESLTLTWVGTGPPLCKTCNTAFETAVDKAITNGAPPPTIDEWYGNCASGSYRLLAAVELWNRYGRALPFRGKTLKWGAGAGLLVP